MLKKFEWDEAVLFIYTGQDMFSLSSLLDNGCWEVLEVKLYLLQLRRNLRTLVLNLQTQTGIVISMKISIHTQHNRTKLIVVELQLPIFQTL